MGTIFFAISFSYIWGVVFIYPPWHKVLRKMNVYKVFLIISILFSIISFVSYNAEMEDNEKDMVFAASYLLVFLIFYKLYDSFILKKYNRHIFFYVKYNSVWGDEESDQSSFMESVMQISLAILPLGVCYFLRWLFIDFL